MASEFANGQQIQSLISQGAEGGAGAGSATAGSMAGISGMIQGWMLDWAEFHGALAQGDIELARGRVQTSQAFLRQKQAEINSDLIRKDKVRIRKQAQALIAQRRGAASNTVAAQRARFAAGGVDVGTGSAARQQDATKIFAGLDSATLELNAARAAIGVEMQATAFDRKAAAESFFGKEAEIAARARKSQQDFKAAIGLVGHFGNVANSIAGMAAGG